MLKYSHVRIDILCKNVHLKTRFHEYINFKSVYDVLT